MGSSASPAARRGLEVAIIGGGITGLALALGLQARGVKYKVYERASGFHEIGAGVGFSPNAERAMIQLNEEMHRAFRRVANPNGEDHFQWIDGYSTGELIYKLYLGRDMFQGCRRSDFIDELAKLVPKQNVAFGKQADMIFEGVDGRPAVIFRDRECVTADIVIGCDGIHSKVRRLLLGEDDPAAHPGYSHKYCFRALVGTSEAQEAIGENGKYRTSTRFMYNGPDAHVITYPVAMGTFLNVLVVLSDGGDWNTADGKHTAVTKKREAVEFFKTWQHPTVKALVDLLPEELDKWAVFDMLDRPAPKYNYGCVAIAGDAAHAAGPHLGAGAGFGIEDALVLATAISHVDEKARTTGVTDVERVEMCSNALSAYNQVRYDRTQWLVPATREACSLFQAHRVSPLDEGEPPFDSGAASAVMRLPHAYSQTTAAELDLSGTRMQDAAVEHVEMAGDVTVGSGNHERRLQQLYQNEVFGRRISRLFHTIWDYDIDQMVRETVAALEPAASAEEPPELWLMGSL